MNNGTVPGTFRRCIFYIYIYATEWRKNVTACCNCFLLRTVPPCCWLFYLAENGSSLNLLKANLNSIFSFDELPTVVWTVNNNLVTFLVVLVVVTRATPSLLLHQPSSLQVRFMFLFHFVFWGCCSLLFVCASVFDHIYKYFEGQKHSFSFKFASDKQKPSSKRLQTKPFRHLIWIQQFALHLFQKWLAIRVSLSSNHLYDVILFSFCFVPCTKQYQSCMKQTQSWSNAYNKIQHVCFPSKN